MTRAYWVLVLSLFAIDVAADQIKVGDYVLANFDGQNIVCFVETLLPTGRLHTVCSGFRKTGGITRPLRIHAEPYPFEITKEASEVDGVRKNDVYTLKEDYTWLRAGRRLRALHVFENGYAQVEPAFTAAHFQANKELVPLNLLIE